MNIDPAVLAQMDREKALWDGKVDEMIGAYRELKAAEPDSSKAFFGLMHGISDVDAWKLMATLACAIQRLADETIGTKQ